MGAAAPRKYRTHDNETLQAFRKGLCVHVLDPHGDMSYDILRRITPKEKERVFLLDPVLVGYSLNPFEIPGGDTKRGVEMDLIVERLIGEITETMKKLFGKQYWGPALNRTFQNAARMLYREADNPTFVGDIPDGEGAGRDSPEGAHKAIRERDKGAPDRED